MREEDIKKILKGREVELDSVSKSRILEAVLDNTSVTNGSENRNTFMNPYNINRGYKMQKKVFAISAIVFVAVGLTMTGAAMASNEAIPGDFAYGVDKAAEKVASVFKFGDVAKVEHEMDLLDERMGELGEVLGKSDVDAEKVQGLLEEVESQNEAVQKRLQDGEFSGEDEERLMNRYQEQVQEHAQLMVKLQAEHQNRINQYNVEDEFEQVKYKFESQEKVSPSENGNDSPGNDGSNGNSDESPGADNGNAGENGNQNVDGVMIQDQDRDQEGAMEGPATQYQYQNSMPE